MGSGEFEPGGPGAPGEPPPQDDWDPPELRERILVPHPPPRPPVAFDDVDAALERLLALVRHTFGFEGLLPMQEGAIRASLAGRDALVVLPTGGGKSLCYQAPALVREGLTLVVSPLIALMKDQHDGLRACGVTAEYGLASRSGPE